MTEPSSDSTIAMRGGGYYSDNAIGAKMVIDATVPVVDAALVGALAKSSDKPFAIADFGAADGGTSLDLMRKVVRGVRAACPGRSITLTYTDLPYNDFSVLFRLLHGLLGAANGAPLADEPGLSTFASATSFHRQFFPDETLSFGFSASAMHWLSAKPGVIADHVTRLAPARASGPCTASKRSRIGPPSCSRARANWYRAGDSCWSTSASMNAVAILAAPLRRICLIRSRSIGAPWPPQTSSLRTSIGPARYSNTTAPWMISSVLSRTQTHL
jgi:hypothetical protein